MATSSSAHSFLDIFYGTHRTGSANIGWGPVYYDSRGLALPPWLDLDALLLNCSLASAMAALILCVASSRGRRPATLCVGGTVILAAYAIVNGLSSPTWLVAEREITSSYCVYTPFKIARGHLRVGVGLDHYNVTFRDLDHQGVGYNDRFRLVFGGRRYDVNGEGEHKVLAMRHGLPNPMITVAEYLEADGGPWGAAIPAAGVYARFWLYGAACSLLATCAFICAIPPLAPRAFAATGLLLLASAAVHRTMLPPLTSGGDVIVEGTSIYFRCGPALWLVFSAGLASLALCLLSLTVGSVRGTAGFATFFELGYGTPWDERVLKEDSERRKTEAEAKGRPSLATQFYVDAKLRVTFRRLRASLRASREKRRSMSTNVLDDVIESGQRQVEGENGGNQAQELGKCVARGRRMLCKCMLTPTIEADI